MIIKKIKTQDPQWKTKAPIKGLCEAHSLADSFLKTMIHINSTTVVTGQVSKVEINPFIVRLLVIG
jgi:hypothetical protein